MKAVWILEKESIILINEKLWEAFALKLLTVFHNIHVFVVFISRVFEPYTVILTVYRKSYMSARFLLKMQGFLSI